MKKLCFLAAGLCCGLFFSAQAMEENSKGDDKVRIILSDLHNASAMMREINTKTKEKFDKQDISVIGGSLLCLQHQFALLPVPSAEQAKINLMNRIDDAFILLEEDLNNGKRGKLPFTQDDLKIVQSNVDMIQKRVKALQELSERAIKEQERIQVNKEIRWSNLRRLSDSQGRHIIQ